MKRRIMIAVLLVMLICQACSSTMLPIDTVPPSPAPPETSYLTDEGKEPYSSLEPDAATYWDFSTVFELCSHALKDYHDATRGFAEFPLELYIKNPNLMAYTKEKIRWEKDYRAEHRLNDEFELSYGLACAEFNAEQGVFYLNLVSKMTEDHGAITVESTEFLVWAVDGRLVIADWYNNSPWSYDVKKRGEFQTIDDVTVWDE